MSTWQAINTWLTFAVAVAVVLVLAATLILALSALAGARRHADRLAAGLETVVENTGSVPAQLPAVNGALTRLAERLEAVDGHLAGVARSFGLR